MRTIPTIACSAAVALMAAVGTYAAVNPAGGDVASRAILKEYLLLYCQNYVDDVGARLAQAEVLSRLVIATGLGDTALVEYAKCKVQNAIGIREEAPYRRKK